MEPKHEHTTAILVFANSSGEETKRKAIKCGNRLFDALTANTLKTVKMAGMPFFHLTETEQRGDSFGERFANAIQYVFDLGYENIITVGNDSPHLTKVHLKTALIALETKKAIIGPSADGGFYLMGLHRSNFKKSVFEALSWQTSRLREEIVSILSDSGKKITMLPVLFDIDTIWDARIIAKHVVGIAENVLRIIQSIISPNHGAKTPPSSYIETLYSQNLFNKGSPLSFFS
ncbi:DUF2064 domain-containing protein [Maribacter algicola]|uniref:DUF2064 domain-containing protein n=1 Tax=Meishania litoralis TaxID=3434685 RepID=A0ACC7LJ34_9FLAO